jgi:hypothetical protein
MDDRVGESRDGKLREEQGVKKWGNEENKLKRMKYGFFVKVKVNVNECWAPGTPFT